MSLIDIHCHLDFDQFKDLDKVIERARKSKVEIIVQNGVNPKSNRKSLELAKKYPEVKLALGIYPVDTLELSDKEFEDELKFIEKNKDKIIAIGEVGIDHHWTKEPEKRDKQKDNFIRIIELAKKIDKPLIVHSREAEEMTFRILQKHKAEKVIMHCFNADFDTIKAAEEAGYYFTIPTIIVRSKHFRKMAKRVSLERLFTETDAPFMSPFQGKVNEPAYITEAVNKIAELRNIEPKEVEDQIMENYRKVFKK